MTDQAELRLEVGDFFYNKIHGYFGLVFSNESGIILSLVFAVLDKDKANAIGTWRVEVFTELEEVETSFSLLADTRKAIEKVYLDGQIDNLSYIEQLSCLNEAEKALKNDPTV